jgi:hypothetical protein
VIRGTERPYHKKNEYSLLMSPTDSGIKTNVLSL